MQAAKAALPSKSHARRHARKRVKNSRSAQASMATATQLPIATLE
jgi:hypothetical protein